jgi:hypothetical protein
LASESDPQIISELAALDRYFYWHTTGGPAKPSTTGLFFNKPTPNPNFCGNFGV